MHAATPAAKPALASGMESLTAEQQGDLLALRGSYAAAIGAYESVSPRTAAVWNKMGMAYHHLFALDMARKNYEMAIRLDPRFAAAYNNLGAVYQSKHAFGHAQKAYRSALRYDPDLAVVYCNLGTTYFAEEKFRQGADSYRRALQLDPDIFNPARMNLIDDGTSRRQRLVTAYNMAKVYASIGRNQEALTSLHTAFAEGFKDRKHLFADKEFIALRELPEFRDLMTGNRPEQGIR